MVGPSADQVVIMTAAGCEQPTVNGLGSGEYSSHYLLAKQNYLTNHIDYTTEPGSHQPASFHGSHYAADSYANQTQHIHHHHHHHTHHPPQSSRLQIESHLSASAHHNTHQTRYASATTEHVPASIELAALSSSSAAPVSDDHPQVPVIEPFVPEQRGLAVPVLLSSSSCEQVVVPDDIASAGYIGTPDVSNSAHDFLTNHLQHLNSAHNNNNNNQHHRHHHHHHHNQDHHPPLVDDQIHKQITFESSVAAERLAATTHSLAPGTLMAGSDTTPMTR